MLPTPRRSSSPWTSALVGAAAGAVAGFLARDLGADSFASLWLAASGLGAVLWMTRLRWAFLATTAALGAAWLAVGFTPLSRGLAAGLVRRDAGGGADAVMVFASRLQSDGEPTAAAASRLLHGLDLLAAARAPRLILTELPPPAPSYAALARQALARRGLSHEVAAVGPVSATRDEAVRVAALCRERGWRRVLAVTSPTHSRRACAALESEGIEVICSPALETEFDLETLDRPAERFGAFRSAVHEWLGIWVYRRRGWIEKPGSSTT